MVIRANVLMDLLKTFPPDAIIRGFEDGISVRNADGAGEVLVLNDASRIQLRPHCPKLAIHLLPEFRPGHCRSQVRGWIAG